MLFCDVMNTIVNSARLYKRSHEAMDLFRSEALSALRSFSSRREERSQERQRRESLGMRMMMRVHSKDLESP